MARAGELRKALLIHYPIKPTLLRVWCDEGLLRPTGGGDSGEKYRFDDLEVFHAFLTATLHDIGLKGVSLYEAIIGFRNRHENKGSPIPHAFRGMHVKVHFWRFGQMDDGTPFYAVSDALYLDDPDLQTRPAEISVRLDLVAAMIPEFILDGNLEACVERRAQERNFWPGPAKGKD